MLFDQVTDDSTPRVPKDQTRTNPHVIYAKKDELLSKLSVLALARKLALFNVALKIVLVLKC